MANHKSALKRNRQNIKRRERNKGTRSAAKSAAHDAITAIRTNPAQAKAAVAKAISVLASTATKGAIPKRRAARKASRLQLALNKAMGGAAAGK